MKISIVGLGLIGGSIAKALSETHQLVGFDLSEQVLTAALDLGVIHKRGKNEDFSDSDVIFLCLYPKDVVKFTKENAVYFGKNAVLTDVCGIKSGVHRELRSLAEKWGFAYVGGHPMAGKEVNSFFASDPGLFLGASYIITEEEGARGTEAIAALAREMGFGRTIFTSPEEHDGMIAFTSQVPHALACAYVMSPRCEKHSGFSAGSYRDVSRVANINEELWSDLFLSNSERLSQELQILIDNLEKMKNAVCSGDKNRLRALLKTAREKKEKDVF